MQRQGRPLHLSEPFLQDESSDGNVLACKPFSSPVRTSPAYAWLEAGSQANGYSCAASGGTTTPPLWIAATHIPDQLQLRFCMLVWIAVRVPGLARQVFYISIPVSSPEVDIRIGTCCTSG